MVRSRRIVLSVALAATAAIASCTTVHAPSPAALHDPCPVFLFRSMAHLALAVPDEQGGYVRYGFGDRRYMSDWSWKQYPYGAFLFFAGILGQPTAGVVERIPLRAATRERLAHDSGMEVFEFAVERAQAAALCRRLDAKCGAPLPDYWWLRETDDGYSLWWDNCQNAVAGWCRELGCEITPWRIAPRWGTWSVEELKP